MKHSGTNAHWNELSQSQRETLDRWKFEDGMGNKEILPRAQAELGFKGSVASLKRYYIRRRSERTTGEFAELRDELAEISGAPGDAESLQLATMKLLGRFLFLQMRDAPEKVKEWAPAAQLMIQNAYNEILRTTKGEEQKIRWATIEFAKEKFQFGTMERALKALPELQELAKVKKDPQTKRYEENAHWNQVRRKMFGVGREVQPENAQEEAEMIAAKREREARQEREAQVESERERIKGTQPPPPSSPYHREYIEKAVRWEEENWKPGGEYEI